METTGRTVGVDSIVCGQKIETPAYGSLRPCWHHVVLYRVYPRNCQYLQTSQALSLTVQSRK